MLDVARTISRQSVSRIVRRSARFVNRGSASSIQGSYPRYRQFFDASDQSQCHYRIQSAQIGDKVVRKDKSAYSKIPKTWLE
ncbi:hypothetical protein HPP92_029090 [Vanilla planifolia]|uniref:Uncharacterized protein n=1 Tax=Vanilla planifolia TaxID=51239 RepID=A0A835P3L0_VANPL|nr:hypothetical protein HPP92_029079 [Vanilla planifolia]KAG0445949.1 hypothetical protein HPP92_029090 [Vanilla planifolia]